MRLRISCGVRCELIFFRTVRIKKHELTSPAKRRTPRGNGEGRPRFIFPSKKYCCCGGLQRERGGEFLRVGRLASRDTFRDMMTPGRDQTVIAIA
jgi:hypothetical protein